ncbi:TraB/GumN family protein [Lysobacter sp. HA18]
MRIAMSSLVLVAASFAFDASAQQLAPAAVDGRLLDTAVVHAPGPGMWKVRRGDNTLWILGTVSALPARMVWNSVPMRRVVASADEVIAEPSVMVDADIGFFGKLALLPSLVGVRSLPDDKTLHDVVPAAQYARWTVLKQQHLGRDDSIERWRPIFAADELYDKAIEKQGLTGRDVVRTAVADAVKARGLKPVAPVAKVKLENPKKVLKEFKAADFADVECFTKTLDRVEHDLPALSARAEAWARGDVQALGTLRNPDLDDVCERAMLGGQFAAKYGMDKLEAQARTKWIAEAEASLARNRTTFATLPINDVMQPGGLVAALAAKGYVVEAPDAPALVETAAPAASR